MTSIITTVVTTIGAFILVYLSVIRDNYTDKKTVVREQLEKFYIPYYRLYCTGLIKLRTPSDLDFDIRSRFFDLIGQNIHLLEPASQTMYTDYYTAFLDLLEAEDGNNDYPIDKMSEQYNAVFIAISETIFTEYKQLLKKAKLPVPKL